MSPALKQCAVSAIAVAMLLLAGCLEKTKIPVTDESKTARAPAGPPEPVTAKTAFWPMYTSGRHWTTDIVILRLTPKEVPGFKNEAGKAAMWEAILFPQPASVPGLLLRNRLLPAGHFQGRECRPPGAMERRNARRYAG